MKEKPAAAVAQLVERGKTGLGKDFYSNQNIQGGMRRFESCPGKAV